MERFRQDLSFAFRSLLRRPGVTLVAVLTLALGIGANVAMVSFAGAILFPTLPYGEPERLVVLERWTERAESDRFRAISFPALDDWQERNRVCSHFAIFLGGYQNLTGDGGEPERLESQLVTANLLETLGIEPYLGRGFTADDDRRGAERTALLSYELWQRRFGGDPGILDRPVHLDDQEYAVIGVLPPGLSAERLGPSPSLGDIWLPVGLFYDDFAVDDRKIQYDLGVVCRLKPGISTEAASADMARITRELAAEHPPTERGRKARVVPVREHLVGDFRPVVLALLAAVVFVLLIACANLSHLFLTRFVAREQEFAVRMALGAGRGRLVLQGLTETLALAVVGSVFGSGLAYYLVRVLPAVADVPYVDQARISIPVLLYTVLLCLVVTLITGLVPSLQTLSPSWHQLVTGALGSQTLPAHRRLRQTLIVGEVALAVVLLAGTGLSSATFLNLRGEDLGFSTERVLSLEVALPASRYRETAEWTKFFDQALAGASNLPGVEAVAVMNTLPLVGPDFGIASVVAADRPVPPREERGTSSYFTVSTDFFRVLGIPLIEGRVFSPHDDDRRDAKRVVVISQSLSRTFWPDTSPIGQRVGFEFIGGTMDRPEVRWREVVGVVADARLHDIRTAPRGTMYIPYTQRSMWVDGSSPAMVLVLKTAAEPSNLAKAVRSEILQIDSNQPVHSIRTLQEIVEGELREAKMVVALFSSFAGLALILAVVGIYGVVSYMVATRTRAIGIRMALGARSYQVVAGLVRQNLVLLLIGIGIGWTLAAILTRLIMSQLYGVDPLDPVIFLGSAILLGAIVLVATLVPAFQVSRVDPARSLHYE